ncbi:hypothetical protein PTT_15376, partial [Pyrenophora teres f. teres 0-1]
IDALLRCLFHVKRRTLRDRRDIQPNSSNLKKLEEEEEEEEEIIQYIRRLEGRGFAPTLAHVGNMANQLLAARVNWVTNFIRCKPGLRPRLTRQRDH